MNTFVRLQSRSLSSLGILLASLVLTWLPPASAIAQPSNPTAPALSTTGNYTVQYDIDYYCGYVRSDVYLQEKAPGSSYFQTVNDVNLDGAIDFSKTVEGIYKYQVYVYCVNEWFEDEWQEWSGEISVNVDIGQPILPTTTEEQIHFTYQVKVGSINGDSLPDIYVKRTSGGQASDGSIDNAILQNAGNGSFILLNPTPAQLATAQTWSTASIPVVLEDINADNYLDVVLKNVGNVISGAYDQIVFAPGAPYYSQPLGVRAIDPGLVSFIEDAYAWYLDDDYVEDSMVWVNEGYWETQWHCYWEYDWWEGWGYYCYPEYNYVDTSHATYPGVDQKVVDMWEAFQAYENGTGNYSALFNLVQVGIGVTLGGAEDCDPPEYPDIDPDTECKGLTISDVLIATSRAITQSYGSSIKFGRVSGYVYVTSHRIFGFLPRHMAVEYRNPVTNFAQWVGAYPKFVGFLNLDLVSEEGKNSDHPSKNSIVARVNSTLSPSAYFTSILAARSQYRNCLTYAFIPSWTSAIDYNSNGFVAGIVSATQGSPDFSVSPFTSFTNFIGGETPVPNVEFTYGAPECPQ